VSASQLIHVWDTGSDQVIEVTRGEAVAGMLRYARTLGPGTPACGELERQALSLLTGPVVPIDRNIAGIENEEGTAHE
jgi:hypothetical protein